MFDFGSEGKHVWKLNLLGAAGQEYKQKIWCSFSSELYYFHFSVLSQPVALSVFINVCLHVFVCTLISRVCCSNTELWKGQMVTFVCDSGLKWDMMWAAPNGLHAQAYTQLQVYARLGCHCSFDPCFLTLHYSEKYKLEKFFILFFCCSPHFFPPLHSH